MQKTTKAAEGQKGKEHTVPTAAVRCWELPPCLLGKKESKSVKCSVPSARWATIQLLRQTLSLRTCWKDQGRDRSGWRKQCSASRLTGKVLQILKRFHGCPKAKSLPETSVSAQFITIPLHVGCFFLSISCYNSVSSSRQMGRDTYSKNSLHSA